MRAAAALVLAGLTSPAQADFAAIGRDGPFEVRAVVTDAPDWLSHWQAPNPAWPDWTNLDTLPTGQGARLVVFFARAGVKQGRYELDCAIREMKDGAPTDILVAVRCGGFPATKADDVHMARFWLDLESKPRDAGETETFLVEIIDEAAARRVVLTPSVTYGEARR